MKNIDSNDKNLYNMCMNNIDYDSLFNLLEPNLEVLEQARKKKLAKLIQIELLLIFLTVISALSVFYWNFLPMLFFVVGIVSFAFIFTFLISEYSSFSNLLKDKLVNLILNKIKDLSSVKKGNNITNDNIEHSLLFSKYRSENRFDTDTFYGRYKGIGFSIVETTLGYKPIVFSGVLINIDIKKSIRAKTIVLPKKYKVFNCYDNIKNQNLEKINLEDNTFNKFYDAFSKDQVEARYLLTTGFLDRLDDIKTIFCTNKFKCSFYDNGKFMMAIDSCKNFFELSSIFTNLKNKNLYRKFCEEILSVLEIIEYFKFHINTGL